MTYFAASFSDLGVPQGSPGPPGDENLGPARPAQILGPHAGTKFWVKDLDQTD